MNYTPTKTKKDILENVEKEVLSSKFVAKNTLHIHYVDKSEAIRFHETDVITKLPNGKVVLSSGGWRTATTKERINTYVRQFLSDPNVTRWNFLSQNKGVWYIGESEFYDGITLSKAGKIVSKIKKPNLEKVAKVKKQISKFVSLITKENLPLPSGGDCWLCSLRTESGETMGEMGGKESEAEHLRGHIKEGYLHGSLLVNAMREAGFEDRQIGVHYQLKLVDRFKSNLRKYLQKRLITNIQVR